MLSRTDPSNRNTSCCTTASIGCVDCKGRLAENIVKHFEAIAVATRLPIILYNIQGRTAINMTAATTLRCAQPARLAQGATLFRRRPEARSGQGVVELLLLFPGALGPTLIEVPQAKPLDAGSQRLTYTWDPAKDGHIVPNTGTGGFAGWSGSARIRHDDQGAYFEIELS